jgi:hypothetical protein
MNGAIWEEAVTVQANYHLIIADSLNEQHDMQVRQCLQQELKVYLILGLVTL